MLAPKLRPGAVVLADNVRTFKRALAPYLDYVQSGQERLPVGDAAVPVRVRVLGPDLATLQLDQELAEARLAAVHRGLVAAGLDEVDLAGLHRNRASTCRSRSPRRRCRPPRRTARRAACARGSPRTRRARGPSPRPSRGRSRTGARFATSPSFFSMPPSLRPGRIRDGRSRPRARGSRSAGSRSYFFSSAARAASYSAASVTRTRDAGVDRAVDADAHRLRIGAPRSSPSRVPPGSSGPTDHRRRHVEPFADADAPGVHRVRVHGVGLELAQSRHRRRTHQSRRRAGACTGPRSAPPDSGPSGPHPASASRIARRSALTRASLRPPSCRGSRAAGGAAGGRRRAARARRSARRGSRRRCGPRPSGRREARRKPSPSAADGPRGTNTASLAVLAGASSCARRVPFARS